MYKQQKSECLVVWWIGGLTVWWIGCIGIDMICQCLNASKIVKMSKFGYTILTGDTSKIWPILEDA